MHRPHRQRLTAVAREQCLEVHAALMQAQEYVGRFFAERQDSPEHARIEIFGQRYMLVRARSMSVEFFEMIQRLYSDKGEVEARSVARSLLFDIAHAMGLSDARDFAERMHLEDPIAKLSAGPIHFATPAGPSSTSRRTAGPRRTRTSISSTTTRTRSSATAGSARASAPTSRCV
jgi:hypothetical protein